MILVIQAAILVGIILVFCGDGGSKSIVSTIFNCITLLVAVYIMYLGASPLITTVVAAALMCGFILIYQYDGSAEGKITFVAVIAIFAIMLPLIMLSVKNGNSLGFNQEEYEITDTNGFGRNIDLSMFQLSMSVSIIALIGVLTDMGIAISSSAMEIHQANKDLEFKELFTSTLTVSKAVLNTSMHTVFYIFLGEYITLFMQYVQDYDFSYIINSKSFTAEFITVAICGVGSCIVVPVSAFATCFYLKKIRGNRGCRRI